MPTLILTPRYTEDSQSLWRAAISLGSDVEPTQVLEVLRYVAVERSSDF